MFSVRSVVKRFGEPTQLSTASNLLRTRIQWQQERIPACHGQHPQRQDEFLIQPSQVRAIGGFVAITDRLHQRKQATGHSNFISVPIART